jgi:hypothetical protein
MDSLTDEIESILYIAREVMGELQIGYRCRKLGPVLPHAKQVADEQCTKYPPGLRYRDTKQQTGMSSNSSGKEG